MTGVILVRGRCASGGALEGSTAVVRTEANQSKRVTSLGPLPLREVELRSDTFTQPTPAMRRAMATAVVGDDVYGEDPTVAELESVVSRLLGKEASCFTPSGTMANLLAVLAHCPRGSKAVVGERSDIFVYEAGGASVCGGIVYHPVPHAKDGSMSISAIERAFPADVDDPQYALPTLICIENPQNECGGRVLSMAHLRAVSALAGGHGVPVHLDGARLFNAALATGQSPAELASFASSVQMCLSKGLGAPVGSMLAGTEEFIARARRLRKMLGGGMRQAGTLAAAALVAIADINRLGEDHRRAAHLAAGLRDIDGIEVDGAVDTNMVFFRVHDARFGNDDLLRGSRRHGVYMAELGAGRIRAAVHRDIGDEDIKHVIAVVRSVVTDELAVPARV